MIVWPKPQKKLPFMGEPFFYGELYRCAETGEPTGIRAACYVRSPERSPTLSVDEIGWILKSIADRIAYRKAKYAVRCVRCQSLCKADVWFLRLEASIGGPWCSDCLDTKAREDLGLDTDVDEGFPLYLVHVNKVFLVSLSETHSKLPMPVSKVDPKCLF